MFRTRDEILNILRQLGHRAAREFEDETLDFKACPRDKRKIIQMVVEYAVCFANAGGGTLVLGVDDRTTGLDKAVRGCPELDLLEMKRTVYDSTDPKILVETEELEFSGRRVILIHIPEGTDVHTTTKGLAKIRVGKDCQPLTGTMRRILPFRKGLADFAAQTLAEPWAELLDPEEIRRMRRTLQERDPRSALLQQPDEQFLQGLGLLVREEEELRLTIAGLLLAGREDALREFLPQHEVTYLHMTSPMEYRRRRDLRQPILKLLESIHEAISVDNPIFTLKVGLFHFEIPAFPPDVYREALLNALTHRDYTDMSGRVMVWQYENRLEVQNPGGLLPGITPENILRAGPRHRNPLLAEALQKLRLVERSGVGIDRMFYIQLYHGKEPPSFETDPANSSLKVSLHNGVVDSTFALFVRREEEAGRPLGLDNLLVLSALRRHRELTTSMAAQVLQVDDRNARSVLNRMVAQGYLERGGRGKGTVFRLSGSVYESLGQSIQYIREKGIDELRFEELILEYVRQYDSVSNRQVRELLGVNRFVATRLLRSLVKKRMLKPKTRRG
ncbi:MAG: putative DNA binding domain-containing protein, partial [Deltaproteobacteria bacterium]|nr:putative DNA binding domain-containing protein [Deltaproteobacteria bacterium]